MLAAPFPWFGGKSRVAPLVGEAFGDVRNYVEPFFGSGAVLLGRPRVDGVETINDLDGFVANFWRAIAADPDAVAAHADWPVNEADLHARHLYLVGQREDLTSRLMADPGYCDVRIAGWWVWGICSWIGGGWCSGNGPWKNVDGRLAKVDAGRGVNRQLPHLGNAGRGVNRQLPHMGTSGCGVNRPGQPIREWFTSLRDRLRGTRVACGDWARVLTNSVAARHNGGVLTGVFLDPPYSDGEAGYVVGTATVSASVREWTIANGDAKHMRIALCGYEGEHEMPPDWQCIAWKTNGGYGSHSGGEGRVNSGRERIWFSPACHRVMRHSTKSQGNLFEAVADGA